MPAGSSQPGSSGLYSALSYSLALPAVSFAGKKLSLAKTVEEVVL
ncbi:MAG: hypothetical protein PHC45_01720 [Clostridiaceae bacterium]|nr:hypothetical protein [Clostridiaceae bacterium]